MLRIESAEYIDQASGGSIRLHNALQVMRHAGARAAARAASAWPSGYDPRNTDAGLRLDVPVAGGRWYIYGRWV